MNIPAELAELRDRETAERVKVNGKIEAMLRVAVDEDRESLTDEESVCFHHYLAVKRCHDERIWAVSTVIDMLTE